MAAKMLSFDAEARKSGRPPAKPRDVGPWVVALSGLFTSAGSRATAEIDAVGRAPGLFAGVAREAV